MLPERLRQYSPPGFHRESMRHVGEALAEAGFAVAPSPAARGSLALRAVHPSGRAIEVWVRARRNAQTVASIPHAQLDPAPHRFVAFVWLRPRTSVVTYLIPSMRWLDRIRAMLGSRNGPGPPAGPVWTFAPHAGQIDACRFDVTLAKLRHGT